MKLTYRPAAIAAMLGATLSVASPAAAQCPDTLPQSLINSVRNPEARAAAQGMRVSAAMIAQAGGLPTMIALTKGQIAADQATAAEEQRNQTYLAQQGMGNDKRAADGRLVIQMMEDSHRLNTAMVQILECHARTAPTGAGSATGRLGSSTGGGFSAPGFGGIGSGAEMLPGAATTPSMAAAAAAARNAFASAGPGRHEGLASPPGSVPSLSLQSANGQPSSGGRLVSGGGAQPANLGQALDDLSRTLRQKALANASPEVAAFYAKQDALRANNEANLAAASAGQARGLDEARRGSVDAQVKMVTGVVKGWRAPAGYAHTASIDASVIQDPFAAAEQLEAVKLALGASGLTWNKSRGLAQVGDPSACGGRLQVGDYPVLIDGTLLDAADRIAKFLSVCGDVNMPVLVVRESGDVEVRK